MERDLYELLGVGKSASADDLKKAHRKMVRQYHPDVNKEPGADKKFAEIQEAYDILSDPEKRKLYDQFGIAGVKAGPVGGGAGPGAGGAGGPFGGGSPFGGQGGAGWQGVDPETFEELFGGMFGGRGGRGARGGRARGAGFGGFGDDEPQVQRGTDHEIKETIDFTTAARGGTRSFTVNGQVIEVRIPAGIADGAKLAVRGKGAPGANGGPAGDLIIHVKVAPHPWIRRDGDDLLMDVPLSVAEAALGTTVRVPLLEGSVSMKVPGGVRSGQKLRVKGKGIARAKADPGDFYAVLQIEAPKDLDAAQRKLLEELGATLPCPRTGPAWEA
jgi:molecular chaperone DnaJ